MKNKKWHIYFIMWISGSGKGTLINKLKDQKNNLYVPLSYKTRKPRSFEKDWIDSYFILLSDFKKSIKNNEFLEYAIVHWKDYYWTKYDDVIKNWILKNKIVIKELDIHWLKKIIKEKPELKKEYTTIFLSIPNSELEERIAKRWEKITKEELKSRKQSAIMEEQEAKKYCDYVIDATKSPEKVLKEVLDIIN